MSTRTRSLLLLTGIAAVAALPAARAQSAEPSTPHATPAATASPEPAPQDPEPATVPESSNYQRTSSLADVQLFLERCQQLPHGDRLTIVTAGRSHEDRPLLLCKVALAEPRTPTGQRLRALVIGNIHAGEVEGKEALQQLIREFGSGDHEELLHQCDVWLLPIYNVDGNEKTNPRNRRRQNGPSNVGQRPNAQGLDLNRDFVKAEALETRALLKLFREFDPHLFVDLHTTNGSYHGYHLTFAPCLSPNQDAGLQRLSRRLLDDATATLKRDHDLDIFDYGNFQTTDWDGGGAPESERSKRGWYTYDSRPRYGVNYYGLRNRIAILSEAYSYCDFETRVRTTRAFVLGLLTSLTERRVEVLGACRGADFGARAAAPQRWFGYDAHFAAPEPLDVLVGNVEQLDDGRRARTDEVKAERMPVFRSFRARQQRKLPDAWVIPNPTPETIALLERHGLEFKRLDTAREIRAERFAVTKKRKPKRPFQGHQELVLEGKWEPSRLHDTPAGSLLVPARQRLAMLAAQLLEPTSDDGMSNWNYFEAATDDHYPVLRLFARD